MGLKMVRNLTAKTVFSITVLLALVLMTIFFFRLNNREFFEFGNENLTVIISQSDADMLSVMFRTQQISEWVLCIEGRQANDIMNITGLKPAKIVSSSHETVIFEACNSKSVGTIHPHFNKNCAPSLSDTYQFGVSGHKLLGIQCDANLLALYVSGQFDKYLKVIKG